MSEQRLPDPSVGRPEQQSGAALASLILGLLSCVLACLAGVPAIICGAIGLKRIGASERATTGPLLTGRGMALVGIILGVFSLVITVGLVLLIAPAIDSVNQAARRVGCGNNVRVLGLGMLTAEATHNVLPAAIVDEDGTPLLSWRVAILPYIGEEALFEQFRLDEPWDSDHNRTLIPRMPTIFACPTTSLDPAKGETTYVAAAGPGMALGGPLSPPRSGPGGSRLAGMPLPFPDGSSKTILLLEVGPGDAVPWTKPADFAAAPNEAAARLFAEPSSHAGGLRTVLFADGHFSWLTTDVAPEAVAAALTRNGSERISLE